MGVYIGHYRTQVESWKVAHFSLTNFSGVFAHFPVERGGWMYNQWPGERREQQLRAAPP